MSVDGLNGRILDVVLDVWSAFFGGRAIDSETSFFELGADSIMAVSMQGEVERRTGILIPAGLIFQASTAGMFAEAIMRADSDPCRPLVTCLRDGDGLRPLFAIAPAVGGVFHYQQFAGHLPSARPLYCVEPRISMSGEHSYRTVEDLAGHCLRAVREIQPEGRLLLCGYSFGGSVAWEMARQLEAVGEAPDLVVLFDTICRGLGDVSETAPETQWGKFLHHVRRLSFYARQWRRYGRYPNGLNILRLLWDKLVLIVGGRWDELESIDERLAAGGEANFNELDAQNRLRRIYDYGSYSGEVHLFRAERQLTLGRELEVSLGWDGRPKGGLRMHKVAGDHLRLMREPAVRSVVSQLLALVETVETVGNGVWATGTSAIEEIPDLDYPYETISNVVERFRAVASVLEHRMAVTDRFRSMSWSELDTLSDRVATAVEKRLSGTPGGVALLMPTTVEFVAVLLGVLKAGRYAVPIEPDFPEGRRDHILKDSGAALVLYREPVVKISGSDASEGVPWEAIDELIDGIGTESVPAFSVSRDEPALVLYTSGSTGVPKGVLHTHISLAHLAWRRGKGCELSTQDRYLSCYNGSFMGSAGGVWACLCWGASLHLFDPKVQSVERIGEALVRYRITLLHAVTTVCRRFWNSQSERLELPYLRAIVPGGEPVRVADAQRFQEVFPGWTFLYASLGATEYGSLCFRKISHGETFKEALPVGKALEGMGFVLINEDGKLAEHGETGEIAIWSELFRPTYWNDPQRNAEVAYELADGRVVFRTGDLGLVNADGDLVNLGRMDRQVKVRGYRIELGEVESAILSADGVKDAFVAALDQPSGDVVLGAFFTTKLPDEASVEKVRQHLNASLPRPMVPQFLWALDRLPTLPNSKTDRRALTQMACNRIEAAGFSSADKSRG